MGSSSLLSCASLECGSRSMTLNLNSISQGIWVHMHSASFSQSGFSWAVLYSFHVELKAAVIFVLLKTKTVESQFVVIEDGHAVACTPRP